MGQLSAKLRSVEGGGYTYWCQGCGEPHAVNSGWTFDGNLEAPTFSPSVLVTGVQTVKDERGEWTGEWVRGPDGKALPMVCHTFIKGGMVQFLGDCTHGLADQTLPLPDLPPHLTDRP